MQHEAPEGKFEHGGVEAQRLGQRESARVADFVTAGIAEKQTHHTQTTIATILQCPLCDWKEANTNRTNTIALTFDAYFWPQAAGRTPNFIAVANRAQHNSGTDTIVLKWARKQK